jgi:hypothetical protein
MPRSSVVLSLRRDPFEKSPHNTNTPGDWSLSSLEKQIDRMNVK